MKKIFAGIIVCALLFCFAGCGKHIPPAEHPGIRCGGIELQVYSLSELECAAPGCSIPRAVRDNFDKMPVNEVSSGEITLFPGSDINVDYSIVFIGAYNGSGEELAELPEGTDGVHTPIPIPEGECAVCAKSAAKTGSGTTVRYIFARVRFTPGEESKAD